MGITIWFLPPLVWVIVLLLPWQPWRNRERIEPLSPESETDFANVDVLIPARDEATHIGDTLAALRRQGRHLRIIVVDDQSQDRTAAIARRGLTGPGDVLVQGKPLAPGWSGKLWALEQGRAHLQRPITLLLDADIRLAPGLLGALRDKLVNEQRDLVSIMARLSAKGLWGQLLLPAFVYYFKLLYPFALVNERRSRVAAAAGGCILMRRAVLDELGGFGCIKQALIDDCALARAIKQRGYAIWLGLSQGAISQRRYQHFASIAAMITRTAFVQLKYSVILLMALTGVFFTIYVLPLWGLAQGGIVPVVSAGALLAMIATYMPILGYYKVNRAWALSLPVIAVIYLGLSWVSAFYHLWGQGSRWRGRNYKMNTVSCARN